MEALYGRAEVLARVRPAIERACSGEGGLILFTGEPGIGKSRLAEQVATEAAAAGATVAWGRCWEAGGAPAYWPWIQVFRGLGMDDDPFAGADSDAAGVSAESRFASFDRAVSALKASAAQRLLVLVLDDLHASDAPSLLLLLLLARELPRARILVIGAYRDAETRLTPEIAGLLAKIAREAQVIPLARLGRDDVAVWVGDAGGDPRSSQTAELYRVTEGHPLFVVEVLRLGTGAQAAWSTGLGAVLDERLGRLSQKTRAVLEVAAVLGREFSTSDLVVSAAASADDVHAALKEAAAINIVVPAAAERARFSHVLIRDRLYAELLPSVRAALHFQAGNIILARDGNAQAAIHHLFEGQSAGPPERIVEVAIAAAEASLSRLAFEDAAQLARRALNLAAGTGLSDRLASHLRLVVAEASIRLGEGAEGKALSLEAAELADRAGADDLLARAALVYGTELASGTIDPKMIALLRSALARLGDGDSGLRARVMGRLAASLTPPASPADVPEVLALTRTATAMARRIGDRHSLLYVLQFASTVALLVPEAERFAIMSETMELARALNQPLVLVQTLPSYITILLAHGERAQAEAALPGYYQLLADFRQPVHTIRRALVDSLFCVFRGDFEEAERLSKEAETLAQRACVVPGITLWLTHRLSLGQLLAKPELLALEAPALFAHFERVASAVPYVTWLLAGLGRHAEAAARLREISGPLLGEPSASLMELMGAAETCVLLADAELGKLVYPRLLAASDRMFWNLSPGSVLGPTARTLGDLALLLGRVPEAVRHYDEAIAYCQKMESPPLVELCQQRRQAALAADSPDSAASSEPGAVEAVRGPLELRREGELWLLRATTGVAIRLKHSKGLEYLQYLLAQPGRQVHVLELAGIEHQVGDAGPVLDARAKDQYRRRLDDLRDELAEAERFNDAARVSRTEQEIDALAEQLAGAVGLGGRDRRAASDVERTRVNVQRRLKDVIERIGAANPALGRYLGAAIKTGRYCAYQPL